MRRPAQTDPEIRRASLAGTILSMLDWRLGDIADFPFLLPPASAAVSEGKKQLLALGAVESRDPAARAEPGAAGSLRITALGRRLAKLPLEPSLSRMLYEADAQGALRDALTVVSALACEDPLLRPAERQEEARQAHAAFRDKGSDFDGILLLWRRYHDPAHPLSRSAMRRDCERSFVSYRRMCEWEDVRDRLEETLRRDGLRVDSSGGGDPGLHRALLSGLLSNIGVWDPEERNYKGAGGSRFVLFPGSGLAKAKAPPQWVMAAELVDTARLFARRAAAIDPDWIEPLARHVCRYHYTGEAWDPKTGTARATRRAVLYGLVVQDGVRCDISRANPALARELLIREGLVGGAFPKPVPEIVRRNLETIAARTEEARKTRALSVDLETDAFCAFLDERLPAECTSAAALRDWLSRVPRSEAERLLIPRPESSASARLSPDDFPDYVELLVSIADRSSPVASHSSLRRDAGGRRPPASLRLPLSYRHDPRAEDDGITCTVTPEAIPLLPLLEPSRLVPGALPGFVAWLLRSLPHAPLSLLAARCGHSPRTPDIDALARLVVDALPSRATPGPRRTSRPSSASAGASSTPAAANASPRATSPRSSPSATNTTASPPAPFPRARTSSSRAASARSPPSAASPTALPCPTASSSPASAGARCAPTPRSIGSKAGAAAPAPPSPPPPQRQTAQESRARLVPPLGELSSEARLRGSFSIQHSAFSITHSA